MHSFTAPTFTPTLKPVIPPNQEREHSLTLVIMEMKRRERKDEKEV